MAAEISLPGVVVIEHTIDVPLDHKAPGGPQITVFAREVAELDGRDRPFLVFLQGGPGFEAPRPVGLRGNPGWLKRALADFRVLLLDQRGTGRSTPVGRLQTMAPAEQADYLTHFRADSIVRDAERMREALGIDRWSVLGQSFGGFCVLHISVDRTGRPARGAHHRWGPASTTGHRRGLRHDLRARAGTQPPLPRALSRRPRAPRGAAPPTRE